jgi:hypothetical protein
LVAFASTETLQYAMDVDGCAALQAVLFLVYLPTLSIIRSNDRMTHDELERMRKAWSCSVKVTPWHFPTGTAISKKTSVGAASLQAEIGVSDFSRSDVK